MADIRFKNEYCMVIDNGGKLILASKITGRVESMHQIRKYTALKDIPINKIPILKDGEEAEPNKIYNVSGKAVIIKKVTAISNGFEIRQT